MGAPESGAWERIERSGPDAEAPTGLLVPTGIPLEAEDIEPDF